MFITIPIIIINDATMTDVRGEVGGRWFLARGESGLLEIEDGSVIVV